MNSVSHGENSLRYLGPKIWNIIPKEFKDLETLNQFRSAIKTWTPLKYPCKLSKNVRGVGFVTLVGNPIKCCINVVPICNLTFHSLLSV